MSVPHLNVTLLGPEGSGKSSLAGHLLLKAGAVDKKVVEGFEKGAAAMNRRDAKYAWLMDRLPEERGRGSSLDLSLATLRSVKYQVVLSDVPGNPRYMYSAMAGTFYADCVVLVLDASPGAFESSMAPGRAGGVREQAALAYTLGVRTMVVAVNQMDAAAYRQERYDQVKREVSAVLKKAGFNPDKVPFVPVSGLKGENLAEPSRLPSLSWYDGPNLLAALDGVEEPKRAVGGALRIPVQDVYNVRGVGVVPTGRIEAGAVRPGMSLRVLPGGFIAKVKAVQEFQRDVAEATAGCTVAISFQGELPGPITRGSVLCDPSSSTRETSSFQAQLLVQHPGGIAVGYCPTLLVHTAHVPCRVTALISRLDRKTGKEVEAAPSSLQAGEVGIVELQPLMPLLLEPFSECAALGRFALRDMQQVVGLGIVKAVTQRQPASKVALAAAAAATAAAAN